MRILLILVLLLANLMLFGANHQMFGPLPYAGLRNAAPLTRELNPSGMQIRPMAPGEYVDHPVVGPADPTTQVRQEDLPTPGATTAASGTAAAGAPASSGALVAASAAAGTATRAGLPASAMAASAASAAAAGTASAAKAGGVHAHKHRKPLHRTHT